MRNIFYTLTVSILLTSCATIVNQPYKYVTVHTTESSSIIFDNDTIKTLDNKAHLKVKRQRKPLEFIVFTDSLTKPVTVDEENSIMYWANLYLFYGLGMLVDMKNPKRWSYPDKVWINPGEKYGYSRFGQANNKGELYLHLSVPLINRFLMKPKNEGTKSGIGVGIASIGLDYYHSKNQFIHFGFSTLWGGTKFSNYDSIIGTGWFSDCNIRVRESMSSDYFSLSNNHKLGQFSVGYGLSFAQNRWLYREFIRTIFFGLPADIERIEKKEYALGFVFPAYFQFGEYFNLGLVYRPTFFRVNATNKFAYEHLISLDFAWKIRLKK